jgi:hypothetical protein
MERIVLYRSLAWAVRIACLALLLWLAFRPKEQPVPAGREVILEYEIAVLLRNDSTLEIVKHERLNRIDSLPDDSVKRIITNWIKKRP